MALFEPAITWVLGHEGGFQNNPADKGNYYQGQLLGTNYGISAPVARSSGYTGRMEDLPLGTAKQIYRSQYWDFDAISSQAVATKILDMVVNLGIHQAMMLVQSVVNTLVSPETTVDGAWGPDTLASVNAAGEADLLDALATASSNHYKLIAAAKPQNETFLDDWLKRAADLPTAGAIAVAGGFSIVAIGVIALVIYLVSKGGR